MKNKFEEARKKDNKRFTIYIVIMIASVLIFCSLMSFLKTTEHTDKEIVNIEICDTVEMDMYYRRCMNDPVLKDMHSKEQRFYAKQCAKDAKKEHCKMTKCIRYKDGTTIPCDKAKKRSDIKLCNLPSNQMK